MRVFCYGTLIFPELMQAAAGNPFAGFPASLEGYACYKVRGEAYPGIIASNGACTTGLVYSGLGAVHLARLDRYEGALFERRRVCATDTGGNPVQAWTYVVAARHTAMLSSERWDPEEFRTRHLDRFLHASRT
jgi:gamma-glutamylcyclotransferase (GGCT)/AIG2-like uncharacterized protein YtfP